VFRLTQHVVRHAAAIGNGVIVRRGSAHFLQEKVRREREAGRSASQAAELVETVDRDHAAFIKKYFDIDWPFRSFYHLMVNSTIGDDAAARTILAVIAAVDAVRVTGGAG